MRIVRVVAIYDDDSQMPCDIMISDTNGIVETLNGMQGQFIECTNAIHNGKNLSVFILNLEKIKGFVPIT